LHARKCTIPSTFFIEFCRNLTLFTAFQQARHNQEWNFRTPMARDDPETHERGWASHAARLIGGALRLEPIRER